MVDEEINEEINEGLPPGGEPPEETDEETGAEPAEENEEATGDTPAAPKKENKVQKRIDELTREKYEAQRERDYYKGLADGRSAAPAAAEAPQEITIPGLPPKPTREQFDYDDDLYFEALADWTAEKKLAVREMKATQTKQVEEKQTVIDQHKKRVESAISTVYPDFDEVVDTIGNISFHEVSLEAVLSSEHSADISYYLGKHKDEAVRISAMPVQRQLVEIGKIEARFEKKEPPPKRVTQAPAPINPVGGKAAIDPNPDNMTDDEWYRHNLAQARKTGRYY